MLHTLVDSRFAVPSPAPWQITRPRLLAALDEAAAQAPLTLVSAGPGAGKTVLLAQWARHRDSRQAAVPPVQVVDDAHLLPDLHHLLDSAASSNRHLVLALRHDPPLPLHRYRLAGQMRELRMPDLAMTTDEIRDLLAAHQVSLPPSALNALAERTEGWAAGVRLAAMRMEHAPSPARLVDELSFGHGGIGEYFEAEVLGRLPEARRRLLTETSFLDEVTGPLAEAVTGLDGAGEMLAELARGNWFVIALDPAATRFRYHRMFREVLCCLLRRDSARTLPELAARAARRLAREGDFERALRWSASAGDENLTSAILVHGGLADAFANHRDIPGTELPGPEAAGGPPDEDTARAAAVAGLVRGMRSGDAHAVDASATRLLASGPPDVRLRGSVLLALAGTRFWHGAFSTGAHDDVDSLLENALTCAQRCGAVRLQADVLAMIACANSYRSRPGHADDAAGQAHSLLRRHPGLRTPPALRLAVAIRSVQQADLAAASRVLRPALVPAAVGADPGLEAALGLWRATVLALSGQPHAAHVLLDETAGDRWPAPERWPALLLVHRDVLLGEIQTSLGRPYAALKHLERHRDGRLAVLADVSRGRAYLALDDLDAARQIVRGVLSGTRPALSRYVLVESMLLDATIAARALDAPRALDMITNALDVAGGDLVLPFAHARSALGDLLARHPAVAGRWPGPPSGGPWNTDEPVTARRARELPVQLTHREKSILAYLATSMTAGEIADELYLSVNTVKTHLAAIYRKLGTGGRRAAVRRARELELL